MMNEKNEKNENGEKKEKKQSSMLKRQMLIISICAVSFIILIIIYLLVLQPMIEKLNQKEAVNIQLLDGEELGVTNRIMITPKVERADMKSVRVKNREDDYKLIHHLGNNTLYVEGAEMVPINGEVVPNLITNAGYLLSMMRVAAKDIEDGNEILADLEPFGLYPENPESYFIVTKTDDAWYKIIIGDKIPTTGGYYVMYEDKNGVRPAIYIVDTTIEETILSTRYSILLPVITEPIKMMESYLIDNFMFYKGRDLFVNIYEGPIDPDGDVLINHIMAYPAPYMVSSNYDSLLSQITNIMGDRVVYAFGFDEELTDEIITEYGFDEYTAKITFDFQDKKYYLIFSKLNENGNYYVLTDFFSIVEVSPDKLKLEGIPQPFIEWDILKFVDKTIFSYNINDVSSVVIKAPGKEDTYFTIAPDPNSDKIRDRIVTGNGKDLIVDGGFRDFYYSILSIEMYDFIAVDTEKYTNAEPMLQMIITMTDGFESFVRDYKFYFVEENTRQCFYTINGTGDFYVLRDKVKKLITDTDLILQNLPIEREAME